MNVETETMLRQYEVVNARRAATDNLLWQAPTLSFTAQSFLFQTALQNIEKPVPVLISMSLALGVSIATLHLMLKHRFYEVRDSKLAELLEMQLREKTGYALSLNGHAKVKTMQSTVDVWLIIVLIFSYAASLLLCANIPHLLVQISCRPLSVCDEDWCRLVCGTIGFLPAILITTWVWQQKKSVDRELENHGIPTADHGVNRSSIGR
jgi:hypothetical protein